MNRCKLEHFADCYVDGSDKEISRAFQERLFSLGAKWLDFNDQTVRFDSKMTHICFDGSRISWNSREYAIDNYSNEIEMEDLKPIPTKFVKVEEPIFDLKSEFERGELYLSDCEGHYTQLKCEKKLYLAAHQDSVHRKVEIDWRDEVRKLDESAIFHDGGNLFLIIDSNSNDFVSMCHEIASLTEKPTN